MKTTALEHKNNFLPINKTNFVLESKKIVSKNKTILIHKSPAILDSDFINSTSYKLSTSLNSITLCCNALKNDLQELRNYELRTLKYLKYLDGYQNHIEQISSLVADLRTIAKNLSDKNPSRKN